MKKRIIIFSVIISLLLTSCVQKFVNTPDYDETITSFLMTKDTKVLVIIGNKYHYIFPSNKKIESFLSSDLRKKANVSFDAFYVDLNNTITGNYSIYLPANTITNKTTKLWLQEVGFKKDTYDKHYILNEDIKGIRYIAKEIPSEYKFNRPYELNIEEEPSKFREVTNIALSPITVTADTTLIITLGVVGFGSIGAMGIVLAPFGGRFQ